MRSIITSIVGAFVLLGCGRREVSDPAVTQEPPRDGKNSLNNHSGTPVPREIVRSVTDDEATQKALGFEAKHLIAQKDKRGEYSEEILNEMLKLAPELKSGNAFWGMIQSIPKQQSAPFRKQIIDALKALTPVVINQPDSDRLRYAYSVALNRVSDPEIARIAWRQFKLAPQYRFPPKPVERRQLWSGGEGVSGSHVEHGLQGVLAKVVLKAADAQLRDDYWETIRSDDRTTQRVLVWALGSYGSFGDFDMLMSMKDNVKDPESRGTLIRAVSRMMWLNFPGEFYPPDDLEAVKERDRKAGVRRRQLEAQKILIPQEELAKFYD